MAILIDPPLWPAHGTIFSHLVSDQSLTQLHAFAQAQGLPERAFDRDHYDVPQKRYETLIAAGAQPVSATELVRRLVRSGLRVPARERPERLDAVLRARWNALLPNTQDLGEDLLARWSQGHRKYHDRAHLLAVLTGLDALTGTTEKSPEHRGIYLAAWFHDAVYQGLASDERESASLARELLTDAGLATELSAEVARLVELTIKHDPAPDDLPGQLLCDADLEVLARAPGAYKRYAAAVREEYAHVSDAAFAAGRSTILRELLATTWLYSTTRARELWESAARENITRELSELAMLITPHPGSNNT
ncbi:hypothetical protein CQ018_16970 [Arthrobacter sp. MYb227]|uniref:DUF4031 domain-containing protein n=1 Tax=Arthrobacter sp. MYb227 TaxID=1848601 RepID=UPI000CFC0E40|nr:DUF4031 domain-containing protein [Arthrobacter sp. MYb227]PQZ88138.1 hypothetical protein CQ018_16970 [Arthrobacter sp. MYb227]